MKDRIKQFFKRNEDQFSARTFVVVTAAALVAVRVIQKENGHRVAGVWSDDTVPAGAQILVTLRNGNIQSYTRPDQQ